jgi:hypothetical protein
MPSKKDTTVLPISYLSSAEKCIETAQTLYMERIHAPIKKNCKSHKM